MNDTCLAWSVTGKPRHGPEYWLMQRTRAQVKLAIRYCKQHEDTIRADMYANALADKNYNKIWSVIRKSGNDRSTLHASSVGGCSGDDNITEMWQKHFKELYNSTSDSNVRDSLLQRQCQCQSSIYIAHHRECL